MDLFTPNPLNALILPAWDSQAVDITWRHSGATGVIGFHVWRAQGAPSNFVKITQTPLQTFFFRDTTRILPVVEEPTKWVSAPDSSTGIIAIRAKNNPLVRGILDVENKPILASTPDVQVINIATGLPYQLEKVEPNSGLIVFGNRRIVNDTFDQMTDPDKPTELANIKLSYFYIDRFTDSSFGRDLYYKVTEVFSDGHEGQLQDYPFISNLDLDPADMFWREAMRRNRFIFEQVGEPAYVLLRKSTGKFCSCVDVDVQKSRTDCTQCWGVGFDGGYDGPYPFTFTPPNYAGQIKQGPEGRFKVRSGQSFIGPTPIINSGDLIFRFNGERLVILDVERTSVRGTTLQQTYTADLLRPADYRNRIQITNKNYPVIKISSNLPAPPSASNSFGDPIPANISLQEGVTSLVISDPTKDITKSENGHPETDLRSNTIPSITPEFENWSF